jgi:predicted Zn-dependent peptidase
MQYRETKLANGIRVATSRIPRVGSIAMGVWVGVGGRYEPNRLAGISHFIEHLLFKGTQRRTARQISEAIEGRGGYFNAFTQEEATCYYARIDARHGWNVLDILADMYLNPRFAAKDIDKERGVIIEEIMMYRDQPQHLVQEMLGELLWARHPLGRPLIGTPDNIMQMSREDILAFKETKYTPSRTVIAFAGNVEHDRAVAEVEKRLGGVSKRRNPRFKKVDSSTRQSEVGVLGKPIEQSHLAMGIRLFGRDDDRRFALKLLSVILGENMSSRLFQAVREKNGLAYSIHSHVHLYNETGVLSISAGLDRARTERALKLIVKELRAMKEKKVGARILKRAKDYAVGQMLIGLESTTMHMMWMGEHLLNLDHFEQPTQVIARLQDVEAGDLQALASDLLRPSRTSVAMIAPNEDQLPASQIKDCIAAL